MHLHQVDSQNGYVFAKEVKRMVFFFFSLSFFFFFFFFFLLSYVHYQGLTCTEYLDSSNNVPPLRRSKRSKNTLRS